MSKLIYKYYSPQGLVKSRNVTHSSCLILEEADKLNIKWEIIPGTKIINLTYQGKTRSFIYQIPWSTSGLARYACKHKKATNNLLTHAGINVPKGYRVRRDHNNQYLKEIYDDLKKPLVVKPSTGEWGENITININSYDKYLEAVTEALAYTSEKNTGAVVEEMFDGTEYRVLATRKKVIGVLYRRPASVLGNGKDNIKKLIKEKNQRENRGIKGGNKSHLKIRIDQRLKNYLSDQKLSLESIPKKGQRIFLRRVSNISQGGDAIDYTDLVHPSVKKICLQAINAIPGLAFTGIDFMSKDITKAQTKDSYVIIEVNDSPGFDIHDYPYEGKNRHAAREFIYLMFPELESK